jgi:hypothetical protein
VHGVEAVEPFLVGHGGGGERRLAVNVVTLFFSRPALEVRGKSRALERPSFAPRDWYSPIHRHPPALRTKVVHPQRMVLQAELGVDRQNGGGGDEGSDHILLFSLGSPL